MYGCSLIITSLPSRFTLGHGNALENVPVETMNSWYVQYVQYVQYVRYLVSQSATARSLQVSASCYLVVLEWQVLKY